MSRAVTTTPWAAAVAGSLLIAVAPAVQAQAADGGTIYYFSPDWSPDGSMLAFESGTDGQLSIFTIGVDGDHLTWLTNEEYNDEGPVWSPDGTRIAFVSNRRRERRDRPVSLQVYMMNVDGTDQRRLSDEGSALDYHLSWSPDGRSIVFQSRPEIEPAVHSLYVIASDGTGRTRVTDGRYNDRRRRGRPTGNR